MKNYLILLMLFVPFHHSIAQDITPIQYFGVSYKEAIIYCQSNKNTINSVLANYGISSEEAMSMVFPEIIRHNRFRDFAETSVLEVAYVQGGKDIADFSIGHFQMKPSFVECIEKELLNHKDLLQSFNDIVNYEPDVSNDFIRNERIERLKQDSWQLKYLACFIRLAEKRFARELKEMPNERLLILSLAYNKGLNSNYADLKVLSENKTFPYGTKKLGRFSYYEIALYFYTHDASLTLNSKP